MALDSVPGGEDRRGRPPPALRHPVPAAGPTLPCDGLAPCSSPRASCSPGRPWWRSTTSPAGSCPLHGRWARSCGAAGGCWLDHTWVTVQEMLLGLLIALVAGFALATIISLSRTLGRGGIPGGDCFPDHPPSSSLPPSAAHLGGLRDATQGDSGGPHRLLPCGGQHRRRLRATDTRPAQPAADYGGTSLAGVRQGPGAQRPALRLLRGQGGGHRQRNRGCHRRMGGLQRGFGLPGHCAPRASSSLSGVYAVTFILSLLGIAMFVLVGLLERALIPWHSSQRRTAAFD